MRTAIVCGGRDYDNSARVADVLSFNVRQWQIERIVDGAARGADTLAYCWARRNGLHTKRYPADWLNYGPSGGPARNRHMLAEAKPVVVIAFPGGRGTADMVQRARAAGVTVVEVTP